jgi:hypothetical protein
LISVKGRTSVVAQIIRAGRCERKNYEMANQPECFSNKISRRSVLLQGAGCAAGVATVLAANAESATANPLPKTAVNYQDTPKGDRQCSGCSLFVAPKSCKNVAGDISPNGWCMLWRKA